MTSIEPTHDLSRVYGDGLRLTGGVDVLDAWSRSASQIELNAVGDALFALVERAVYRDYEVIDDPVNSPFLVIVVRENLAIRAELQGFEAFRLDFIGRPVDALPPFEAQ